MGIARFGTSVDPKRGNVKQYLVHAYDATDANALDRRMAVRSQHLAGARELKDRGNFLIGGAILDDDARMIGSVMILQFESDESLAQWQSTEPYILNAVWERYEIRPFRVAEV